MAKLITDIEQVTPDWLTEVLQKQECLDRGKVMAVEKSPQTTNTTIISPLKLTYSDGASQSAPSRLFLKISHPGFRSNIHISNKLEVDFYNVVVPAMTDPPAARCYDAVYSPETDQAHILLEDLSETHIQYYDLPPMMAQCEQAIDCIAKMHAFWWEDPRLGKDIGALLDGQSFIKTFEMEFPGFVDFLGDRLFTKERKLYEKLLSLLPTLWERHLQPRFDEGRALTLVHKDLHFSNFFFPNEPGKSKAYIIDWTSWSGFLGPLDLAYAIALSWSPRRRHAIEKTLVKRYHEELLKHGVENYNWHNCWQDYRRSVLITLLVPIMRWAMFDESKTGWWWDHLEKAMLAFEDLDCIELAAQYLTDI